MEVLDKRVHNKIGFLKLNAEKSLNALSMPMIDGIIQALEEWRNDPLVECIFIEGAGEKSFCAGGDIRMLYEEIMKHDDGVLPQGCLHFFEKEYRMNYDMSNYPKPIISWCDGIVMGGGAGLMQASSHRVVTERTLFAMPEISIGLYPDVGATYFLNQLPSAYGLFLGLTAMRLSGADCIYVELADAFISSERKQDFIQQLRNTSWKGNAFDIVDALLNTYSEKQLPISQAELHKSFISKFENITSLLEFKKVLLEQQDKTDWMLTAEKNFLKGSPTSTHIIFRQLFNGKKANLAQVFRSELNLTCQCCMHTEFPEGIRALLIDKDFSPQWKYPTIEEVPMQWIERFFVALWDEEIHPFKDLK